MKIKLFIYDKLNSGRMRSGRRKQKKSPKNSPVQEVLGGESDMKVVPVSMTTTTALQRCLPVATAVASSREDQLREFPSNDDLWVKRRKSKKLQVLIAGVFRGENVLGLRVFKIFRLLLFFYTFLISCTQNSPQVLPHFLHRWFTKKIDLNIFTK